MSERGIERRWRHRIGWAAAAQSASSITNFALYVGLLVWSDTENFGRWVAVLAVHHLVVALARSLVSEAMVAAAGAPRTEPGRGGDGFSWSWAVRRYRAIGVAAALGAALVGWRVGADPLTVALVAAAQPFLVAQDGLRSLAWAQGRPQRSVALDGVWIAATGVLLAVALTTGMGTSETVVVSWLAGGMASTGAGQFLVARHQRPIGPAGPPVIGGQSGDSVTDPDGVTMAARLHARRRSQALLTSARNLLPTVVALTVGPTAAGLLKGALLPYTPVLSLLAGLRMVVLPQMQRAAEASASAPVGSPDHRALDRFVTRLVGIYLAVAGAAVAVSLLVVRALADPLDAPEALRADVIGWGAVIAVVIAVATPLADGIGFGRRPVMVVRRRLAEIAIEWGAVFAAAAIVAPDQVVVGWAVGVAVGGLLWLAPGLGERRHPDRLQGDVTTVS